MKKFLLAVLACGLLVSPVNAQVEITPIKGVVKAKSAQIALPRGEKKNLVSDVNHQNRMSRAGSTVDAKVLTYKPGADPNVYKLSGLPAGLSKVATFYSQDLLNRFHGNTISTVRTFICAGGRNVRAWIMDAQTSEILWEKKDIIHTGGNEGREFTFNCDYVIDKNVPIIVGYDVEFTQSNNSIAIVNNMMPLSLIMQIAQMDEELYDYSSNYPSAYIECVTEGAGGLMANDVSVMGMDGGRFVSGGNYQLPVYFYNFGTEVIKSLKVNYAIGENTYESEFSVPEGNEIGYMGGVALKLEDLVPEVPARYHVDMEITAVNGEADGYPADNKAAANMISIKEAAKRKVVMEEFTGTWCGWCPRGIVAVEGLKEVYPNDFVAICVHYNDPLADNSYMQFMNENVSGFPSATLNRMGMVDPYYGSENSIVDDVVNILSVPSEALVGVASELSDDKTKVNVKATLKFGINASGKDYRVGYALTEDGLAGLKQTNYYAMEYGQAGSAQELEKDLQFLFTAGPEWETTFNDVSRRLEGTYGIEGSLDDVTIEAGKTIVHECSFNMPRTVKDVNNLYVIALLFDVATGEIVTAEKAKVGESVWTAIDQVNSEVAADVVVAEGALNVSANGKVQIYTIDGKLVSNVNANGSVSVPTMGMKGVHVVRVITADGVKVMKVAL